MDRLAGKVALVTGAASGIGVAIVKRFLSEGAQVVATYVSDFPTPPSDGVVHMSQDTANENDLALIIMRVIADCGRLDFLVNNAGVSARKSEPLAETTLDEWRRVLSFNLDGGEGWGDSQRGRCPQFRGEPRRGGLLRVQGQPADADQGWRNGGSGAQSTLSRKLNPPRVCGDAVARKSHVGATRAPQGGRGGHTAVTPRAPGRKRFSRDDAGHG